MKVGSLVKLSKLGREYNINYYKCRYNINVSYKFSSNMIGIVVARGKNFIRVNWGGETWRIDNIKFLREIKAK